LQPTIPEVVEHLGDDYQPLPKRIFSCWGAENFRRAVEESGRRTLVLVGIETHICVQQTVLGLLEQGYRVVVLQDCTGARFEHDHVIAMERFRKSNAIIGSFEGLAFEWTRTKDHPAFKQVSALVRE